MSLWRRQWHPTPVLLPGKSHGQRSCSPGGREESDTTEHLHSHFSLSCIGEGNGNPLQCSCLENPRDWGAWWAAVYGVAQSWTRLKWLSSSSMSKVIIRAPLRAAGKIKGENLPSQLDALSSFPKSPIQTFDFHTSFHMPVLPFFKKPGLWSLLEEHISTPNKTRALVWRSKGRMDVEWSLKGTFRVLK